MTRKNFMTRVMISALAIPLTLCASQSQAGHVGVDIHLGVPLRQEVIVQRPVYRQEVIVQRPVYRQPVPAFYFDETPEFVYQDSLGFSVAEGSPYDLFYDNDNYYIYQDGNWHRSSQLNGSWRVVEYNSLPRSFRRHNIEEIRRYRHHRGDSHDRRFSRRYSREHQDRDQRYYREERRPRQYEQYEQYERHNR